MYSVIVIMLNIFSTKLSTYTSLWNQAAGQNYNVYCAKIPPTPVKNENHSLNISKNWKSIFS